MIRKDIEALKLYYKNLAWYHRWFFPSKLSKVLLQPTSTPSHICRIFDQSTSWFSYILGGLRQFYYSNSYVTYIKYRVGTTSYWIEFLDLFEEEEVNGIQKCLDMLSPTSRCTVINILKLINDEQPLIYTEAKEYFTLLVRHKEPDMLLEALSHLKGTSLLTGDDRRANILALLACDDLALHIGGIPRVFKALSQTKLLTNNKAQNNFNAVMQGKLTHGGDLDQALLQPGNLCIFQGEEAQECFELIAKHEAPTDVTSILACLKNLGVNIKTFLPWFKQHQYRLLSESIISIFTLLNAPNLLQGHDANEMIFTILNHKDPSDLENILSLLAKNNLLNPATMHGSNFSLLVQHKYLNGLLRVLQAVDNKGLLTNENLYINYVAGCNNSIECRRILELLSKSDLLRPQNIEKIINHSNNSSTISLIMELTHIMFTSGLLTTKFAIYNFLAMANRDHTSFSEFRHNLLALNKAGLLASQQGQNNFNMLTQYINNNRRSPAILHCLYQNHLLSQANFEKAMQHKQIQKIYKILESFSSAGLLVDDTRQLIFDLIIEHTDSLYLLTQTMIGNYLSKNWSILTVAGIINKEIIPEDFDRIIFNYVDNIIFKKISRAAPNVKGISSVAQFILQNANNSDLRIIYNMIGHYPMEKVHNLFTTLYINMQTPAVASHIDWILNEILPARLLTEENISWLCDETLALPRSQSDLTIFHALYGLARRGILTQDRLNTFKVHRYREDYIWSVAILSKIDLLTKKNFDTIVNRNDLPSIRRMLNHFIWHRLERQHPTPYLAQTQFTAILTANNPSHYLLSEEASELIDRIPEYLFTQATWNEIFACCTTLNPRETLQAYIDGLLPQQEKDRGRYAATAHSVAESTTRLFNTYKDRISSAQLNTILDELSTWVHALPKTDKNDTAKRCMARIINIQIEQTGVNLQQLLALAWVAIHDDRRRTGTLEDAKQLLIDGLREIQRGYNLSERDADNLKPTNSIYHGDTFNKILEKLNGIIPDVELQFVTPTLATIKLPLIVHEEARRYLSYLARYNFPGFTTVIDQINITGIKVIWDNIKAKVTERLFDEFGCLYQNNNNDREFIQLAAAGSEVPLDDDIDFFQRQISQSESYRQYCTRVLRHSSCLFSPRNFPEICTMSHSYIDEHVAKIG